MKSLHCPYCAKVSPFFFKERQNEFEDTGETVTFEDAVKYNHDTICPSCGCSVRINECVLDTTKTE